MISASLDAWLRPSSTSQPKTRTMIRYSSRTHMNRDPAATYPSGQTAAHSTCGKLWSSTGDDAEWDRVATSAHMDVFDESTVGLRELLLRRGGEPDTLIAIASRYL